MRALLLLGLIVPGVLATPARADYYYSAPIPPPWIRPKTVSGSLAFSGFGAIVIDQHGGSEFLKHGGGVGLDLGLYIGRFVGIRLGYDASFHNPANTCSANPSFSWCGADYLALETVHANVLIRFPTETRFQPLIFAGVLVAFAGRLSSPLDSIGGGIEAGLGFDVWVSRYMTVGVEAKYRGIEFGDFATSTNTGGFLSLIDVGGNMAIRF